MAAAQERWLVELFEGFDAPHRDILYAQLGRLRAHVATRRPLSSPPDRERVS